MDLRSLRGAKLCALCGCVRECQELQVGACGFVDLCWSCCVRGGF